VRENSRAPSAAILGSSNLIGDSNLGIPSSSDDGGEDLVVNVMPATTDVPSFLHRVMRSCSVLYPVRNSLARSESSTWGSRRTGLPDLVGKKFAEGNLRTDEAPSNERAEVVAGYPPRFAQPRSTLNHSPSC